MEAGRFRLLLVVSALYPSRPAISPEPPPRWRVRARQAARSRLAREAAALYAVQAARAVAPLLVLPYLTRVLGPEAWGAVGFALAYAALTAVPLESGLGLATQRAVAQAPREQRAALLADGTAAKLGLALLVVAATWAARPHLPFFQDDARLFFAAAALVVATAASPLWFYFGIERAGKAALVDAGFRSAALLLVIPLVNGPADAWRVPALQAGGAALASGALGVRLALAGLAARPGWAGTCAVLRDGRGTLAYRASAHAYLSGTVVLLGFAASPVAVGVYAAAERVYRGAQTLLGPLWRVLYPRMSRLHATAPDGGRAALRLSLLGLGGAGLALGLVQLAAAPLVPWLFGAAYADAVPALAILSAAHPLAAVAGVLATQWLLPARRDLLAAGVTALAAALAAACTLGLGASLGAVAGALAIVLGEGTVAAVLALRYRAETASRS